MKALIIDDEPLARNELTYLLNEIGGFEEINEAENVKETLETLKAHGYTLAVVTNKPTRHVQPVLAAFGIDHLFSEMLGGQSLPAIKPHPGPLYYLCGKFGVEPRQVLFVGDSRNDILAAHSAGCPAVGLTYGYNYNIPIAESNPDWVFDDFAKLLEIL